MIYLLKKNIKIKKFSDKLDHIKLGPFQIKKKLKPVTFKLKVGKKMRIYLVFYISLLKSVLKKVRSGLVKINKELQESRYKIENVIKYKLFNNKSHYLIH